MIFKKGDPERLAKIRATLLWYENNNQKFDPDLELTLRQHLLFKYIKSEGMVTHDNRMTYHGKTKIMRLIENITSYV